MAERSDRKIILRELLCYNNFSYFIFSDKRKEIMTMQRAFNDYTEI